MNAVADVLPDASWRHHRGLVRIIALMHGAGLPVRFVGGAVRDSLIGAAVTDVDLATPALPADVTRVLAAGGVKVVPTGIDHGTVTAVADSKPYEITTLRRDVSTDGRHATVAFSDDWRDDAARRDFTINALYADPATGEVFDDFGGRADLSAGCVRFIGDPAARIAEDHLRILRYYRFAARFGSGARDAASHAAVVAAAPALMTLSRERVADEVMKLLALPDPVGAVTAMADDGILATILPESGDDASGRLAVLIAAEAASGTAASSARRLIALLPPDAALADKAATRLKMSKRLRKRIAAARGVVPVPGAAPQVRAAAYRHGAEAVTDALLLAGDAAGGGALIGWDIPRLPVGGNDVLARGISAGPDVAALLKTVEDQWVAEGFPDRARTLALLDQISGLPSELRQ
ncbi:MAG: Polynucleotide adenylyltransferase region [Pseudomonadota bacterium]